ncbi:hypothetical protein LSH36_530g03016 [Paralvinella palmiformis]|uniref:Uncharacterized protein n=1 Tax=Paralvinella palmiformis TaxID=53620 RepID=A0AAD9J8L5_9ANNE|nr:hypothetical protein LSH36_530g03016 [Paralvinella palmiformis]
MDTDSGTYRHNRSHLRKTNESDPLNDAYSSTTNAKVKRYVADQPAMSDYSTDTPVSEDVYSDTPTPTQQNTTVMTAAKLCGKNAPFNGDKLKVDGHSYGVDDIPNLPSHLNPEKACTKRTNYVIIFFGKHSPLSNFHECSLTHDGAQYTGVEQRYQQKKAERARNDKLAQQIISTTFPARQKYLGDKVKVDDETWKTTGLIEMYNAVKAKYFSK